MNRNLGELGKRHDPAEVEFQFFDETIRANPNFGEVDLVDFMEAAEDIDEDDGLRALPLIKKLLQSLVHADDFDRFWAAAKTNRQSMRDLMQIGYAVLEAVAGRPTGRSSDSTDGPPSTGAKSTGDSYSRAMRETAGRPDLQLFVRQAEEARRTA